MIQELLAVVVTAGQTFMKILPISIGVALLFTVLTWFWSCNPGRAWWHKSDLATDLCYWLIIPIITRFLRIGMLIAVAAIVLGITSANGLVAFYEHGHGPLAALPLVAQGIIFLIGQDFIMYWTHRWFHGETMWKYHAVHHSTEELEWISAARFHPINLFLGSVLADVTMLFAGISPTVFVVLGPLTVAHSALVHANLDWTLGPFKYIFAGPVFHRWHHTSPDRGGEKNFAGTFSLFDVMFGTFYMPEGQLPDRYGIDEHPYPQSFGAQLLHPFKQRQPPQQQPAALRPPV